MLLQQLFLHQQLQLQIHLRQIWGPQQCQVPVHEIYYLYFRNHLLYPFYFFHLYDKLTFISDSECELGWKLFKGYCYLLTTKIRKWDSAEKYDCGKKGAHLASILSKEENEFLHEMTYLDPTVHREEYYNIGGYGSTCRSLRWTDGADFVYENFYSPCTGYIPSIIFMPRYAKWFITSRHYARYKAICKKPGNCFVIQSMV